MLLQTDYYWQTNGKKEKPIYIPIHFIKKEQRNDIYAIAPCILQSGSKILTLAAPDGEALDGAFGTYKGEY